MKVRGALYILTYEYNFKVITSCDTILQEYYITGRCKCENTKRYTSMNNIKDAHKLQKKLESLAGGQERKDSKRSADNPRFSYVSLISNWENP